MYPTPLLFRVAKAIAVSAIALMSLLIVFGNTTDYFTNYHFVEHVMKMDTIFPGSLVYYRHIDSQFIYHTGYILLIIIEVIITFCCIKGSWSLFKSLKSAAATFHAAKNWAIAGITIGIILWFLGFEVIGGEWFAMWQSQVWNGLGAAERIVSFLVLILILLHFKEEEITSSPQ